MAVYIDKMNAKYKNMIMCHMLADTEKELIDMAKKIGVNPKWIQKKGTYQVHFDICKKKKEKALSFGAIEITRRELMVLLNKKKKERL